MIARLALLVPLLGAALAACTPTISPVESSSIERGTALPPPGLSPPGR